MVSSADSQGRGGWAIWRTIWSMVPSTAVPVSVRAEFAHAVIQYLAAEAGLDIFHVKGPALSPDLVAARGGGSDADVWTRPEDAERLIDILLAHGWVKVTGFHATAFKHAAAMHHELFGYADIHRYFPGLSQEAFVRLWPRRVVRDLGGMACACLDPAAERLVLMVHAARSGGNARDLGLAWHSRSDVEREEVRRLVADLDADVAFAAALGRLEEHRGSPDYGLWRSYSGNESRLDKLFARISAADTWQDKALEVMKDLRPNVSYSEIRQGRHLGPVGRLHAWVRHYQWLGKELVGGVRTRLRRER